MQVKPEQLEGALSRGLQRVYTIHGDESLLVQEAADAVRAAARAQGYSERHVFTVSGAHFDWAGVFGASQAMSLFAQRQIIDLRIPSGKPGKEGSTMLQRYCESLSDDVITLVQLPRLDGTQTKSAWFAALDAAGVSVRVDPVERHALPAWLARRLAAHGHRVADGEEGRRSLEFLADRVEGHLLAAHQEISKLALLYPAGVLSYEQVEAAVLNVARYDVTKLTEAVFAGQVARALRVLDGLQAEGEPAVLVLWMLAEDLRALMRVRDALGRGRPLPMAMQDARVWGVKQRLLERVVPQFSEHRLAYLVESASICDGIVKGLTHAQWPNDPWRALERLILLIMEGMATGARPPPGSKASDAQPHRLALKA